MKVKVLFFGRLRDLTGLERDELQVPEGTALRELWGKCERRFPRLTEATSSLVAAVNQEVADGSCLLHDGDEVAFMPPVSGGVEADTYRITRQPIDPQQLAEALKAPEDGAVVTFVGVVRNNSHGRRTRYIDYEAYEPMAIRKMAEIGEEVRRRFAFSRLAIVHRTGRLAIGETAVAIVVTAPHREAAFAACHYAIDRLKQIVPIWKKEYFEDGAAWVEGEQVGARPAHASGQDPR